MEYIIWDDYLDDELYDIDLINFHYEKLMNYLYPDWDTDKPKKQKRDERYRTWWEET